MDGSLCLYTYEDTATDSDGNRQTTYVHYTLAMTQLPDTAAYMRSSTASVASASGSWTRPRMCSASASGSNRSRRRSTRSYEIFIGAQRRHEPRPPGALPPFLVWLDGHSPEAYAFELCRRLPGLQRQGAQEARPSSTRSARPRRPSPAASKRRPTR